MQRSVVSRIQKYHYEQTGVAGSMTEDVLTSLRLRHAEDSALNLLRDLAKVPCVTCALLHPDSAGGDRDHSSCESDRCRSCLQTRWSSTSFHRKETIGCRDVIPRSTKREPRCTTCGIRQNMYVHPDDTFFVCTVPLVCLFSSLSQSCGAMPNCATVFAKDSRKQKDRVSKRSTGDSLIALGKGVNRFCSPLCVYSTM